MVDFLSLLSRGFFEKWESRWFPQRVTITDSGTRQSSRRRVAGFASGGSRFLRRNYPAFVSGEETLMALRSSSTVITGSAKIGWFVWFPRECSRCVKGSLWRWGPELGWDLDSFDWFSPTCTIEETESIYHPIQSL